MSNTDPALPGDDHGEGRIVGEGDDQGKGFGGKQEDEWELSLKTNGASDFYFQVGAARRIEQPQPACGAALGLP